MEFLLSNHDRKKEINFRGFPYSLFNKLYHFKKNEGYHIIGFLCVDSMSKNAFRPEQEIYNCNLVNTFADEFYVILSMYRHYLNKIK